MVVYGTLIQHISGFDGSGNPVGRTSSDSLGQSAINSGDPIWLPETDFTWSWGNIIQSNPIDGQGDAVEVRQGTIENPLLSVNGIIDIDSVATGSFVINGRTASSKLTQDLMVQLAKLDQRSNSFLLLEAKYGTGGTAIKGRDLTSGYPSTTTSMVVVFKGQEITIPSDSDHNHIWRFKLTLSETKDLS